MPVFWRKAIISANSSLLFKLAYSVWLDWLDEKLEGVELFGVVFKYWAFADDTVVPFSPQTSSR